MEAPQRMKPRRSKSSKRSRLPQVPLPPLGTPERIEAIRDAHTRRQLLLRRRCDIQQALQDDANEPATFPVVRGNGHLAGRVIVDPERIFVDLDAETPAAREQRLSIKVDTVSTKVDRYATNPKKIKFCSKLRILRRRAGLSVWMAARLAGITRQGWHRLESGKAQPRLVTVGQIARALNVQPGELVG